MSAPAEPPEDWASLLGGPHDNAFAPGTVARAASMVQPMWESAQARYGNVVVSAQAFAAALTRAFADQPDPVDALKTIRGEDLYLALACAEGHKAALTAFEREVMPTAAASLRKSGATAEEVNEVQQALRERLLLDAPHRPAKVRSYAGRGRLSSWVSVAAMRLLHDLRRSNPAGVQDDDALLQSLAPNDDPELAQLKEVYRAEFRLAFAEAVGTMDAGNRTLLRQQWVDGLASHQLAPLYDVHRATVSRWLVRAQEELVERTRLALGRRLGLDDEGVQSIVGLIRTRLDASVHRLLREEDPTQ